MSRARCRLAARHGPRAWGWSGGGSATSGGGAGGRARLQRPPPPRWYCSGAAAPTRGGAGGSPHRPGQPEWPRYTAETESVLELGPEIRTVTGLRASTCDEADRKNAEAVARWRAGL